MTQSSNMARGAVRRDSRAWWRRPWMVPLALIAIAFLAYSLPPYLSLDPSRSRVPLDYPLHYLFVVGHVLFGTIALVTACLQVWRWLRVRHPAIHRWSGRLFVFAGMLPAALCSLAIMPFSFGPFGNAVAAVLWLATSFIGYRMARQRRYAEHRRYMIYAFAITMQIIWARVLVLGAPLVTDINLNDQLLILETVTWFGFVVNLTAAQLWLDWTARRQRRAAVRVAAGPRQPASNAA